jgi:hypothetical protein
MTTPAVTPTPLPAGATFGEPQDTPITLPAQTPLPAGATFGEPAEAASTIAPNGKPKFAPYDAAAFGRYTTPENYEKWASVHPKIGPDSKPGEYEAWSGANTPGGYKETLMTIPEATAETAAGVVGAPVLAAGIAAAPEIAPLAAKAAEYLSHLDNIVKVAKTLGYTSFGLEQAHNIYKWVSGDDKKKSTTGQ